MVFSHHRVVLAVVAGDPRRLKLERIARIVELCLCAVGRRGLRVGHDIVRGQDLGVRQVVLRHVGDQLERRTREPAVRPNLPGSVVRVEPVVSKYLVRRLGQVIMLIDILDKSGKSKGTVRGPLKPLVREQPVIAASDQEPVEALARHQPSDRCAQVLHPAAAHGRQFRRGRGAAREHQRRPPQRPGRGGHGDAFEQSLRRPARPGGAAVKQPEKPLQKRELRRACGHLHAAPVRDALDLVQHEIRPALDGRQELAKRRQVAGLVIRRLPLCEHQPRVTRNSALHMATGAAGLHDRRRDVVAEHLLGGRGRGGHYVAPGKRPRLAAGRGIWPEPALAAAKVRTDWGERRAGLGTNRTDASALGSEAGVCTRPVPLVLRDPTPILLRDLP